MKTTLDNAVKGIKNKDIQVAGINATGAIIGKTIEQTEPNWELDLKDATISVATGATAEIVYGKIEVVNNILYIVGIVKIVNATESSIALANSTNITFSITDDKISGKIYDVNGIPMSENGTNRALITSMPIYRTPSSMDAVEVNGTLSLGRNGVSKHNYIISNRNSSSIPANTTWTLVFRTFLTL